MGSDREDKPTQVLDSRTITGSWPLALATLEQCAPFGRRAQKLGLIALLRHCTTQMLEEDASADLIDQAEQLLKALRFMQWNANK